MRTGLALLPRSWWTLRRGSECTDVLQVCPSHKDVTSEKAWSGPVIHKQGLNWADHSRHLVKLVMPGRKRRQPFLPGCSRKQGYFYAVALLKDRWDVCGLSRGCDGWHSASIDCMPAMHSEAPGMHKETGLLVWPRSWRGLCGEHPKAQARARRGCREGPGEVSRDGLEQQTSRR